ncbi:hypothetical protein [Nocardia sp. NPDC058497]|uniref:hypothetical protein n=1 Tax=Nocardia sp. NPDC058497 TaxID=3346529 RepID=UPI003648988F
MTTDFASPSSKAGNQLFVSGTGGYAMLRGVDALIPGKSDGNSVQVVFCQSNKDAKSHAPGFLDPQRNLYYRFSAEAKGSRLIEYTIDPTTGSLSKEKIVLATRDRNPRLGAFTPELGEVFTLTHDRKNDLISGFAPPAGRPPKKPTPQASIRIDDETARDFDVAVDPVDRSTYFYIATPKGVTMARKQSGAPDSDVDMDLRTDLGPSWAVAANPYSPRQVFVATGPRRATEICRLDYSPEQANPTITRLPLPAGWELPVTRDHPHGLTFAVTRHPDGSEKVSVVVHKTEGSERHLLSFDTKADRLNDGGDLTIQLPKYTKGAAARIVCTGQDPATLIIAGSKHILAIDPATQRTATARINFPDGAAPVEPWTATWT